MRTLVPNREDISITDDSDLKCMAHEIALAHHEKWDGSGYPNGLADWASVLKM